MKRAPCDDETDGQLIRRFAEGRDERAFAILVKRHGALVAGVCARLLRHRQDAEDAFQATFLVLARRAAAVRRRAALAGWLHDVAVRVCLNEHRRRRRRQRHMQEAGTLASHRERPDHAEALKRLIDEELAALPARLREVVILCDLEGRTQREAARLLSAPVSAVGSRLARGREALRKRLVRRGLAIAAVSQALAQCGQAAPAVSAELVRTTVRNSQIYLAGTAAAKSTLGFQIHSLAEGVLHAMIISQWKTAALIAALTALFSGALAPTVAPGLRLAATASAAQFFYDDFNDGSATDGSPVTWSLAPPTTNLGTYAVTGGDLVLSPATQGPITLPDIPNYREVNVRVEDRVFHDVDVRTRVRASNNGVYVAGITLLDTYQHTGGPFGTFAGVYLVFDGQSRYLRLLLDQDFTFIHEENVNTSLSAFAGDVNLRFRIAGDQASFWAWPEGQSEPLVPQLTAQLPNDFADVEGYVGVIAGGLPAANPVTFRFVNVVPEPAGGALALAGGGLLASFALARRP